jgi:CheY-like chemotaxis protein
VCSGYFFSSSIEWPPPTTWLKFLLPPIPMRFIIRTMVRGSQKRVLIIEDDEIIRRSYVKLLQIENYEVHEAADGQKGLEAALQQKPDVILLDLLMPEMNGETMLEELRKDSWGKDAKVIILTNFDKPKAIYETLVQNNALNYLVKANTNIKQLALYIQLATA